MTGSSDDRPRERGPFGLRSRMETGPLASVGYVLFVSGFFVLAAAGTSYPVETYALIAVGAALVAIPLLLLMQLVAVSETFARRAWAAGFRALDADERTGSATLLRGLRYAAVLWLANGVALWTAAAWTTL